ncbi:MAG: sensor histidine kinase [Acidobacteriota bacterium]
MDTKRVFSSGFQPAMGPNRPLRWIPLSVAIPALVGGILLLWVARGTPAIRVGELVGVLFLWIGTVGMALVASRRQAGRWREEARRRRLEELRATQIRSERAVRHLAEGIAHHLHNDLAVLRGSCEMARASQPGAAALTTRMDMAIDTIDGAVVLISQLLAYAGAQASDPLPVNLQSVVLESLERTRSLSGPALELVTRCQPDVPPVRIEPCHVEQMLVQLVDNCRFAMPGGGAVLIELSRHHRGPSTDVGVRQPWVRLEVSDSGCGMVPDVCTRAAEPFFTTRAGRGHRGLGLAMVDGLARQHGGRLDVRSQPGEGTTVSVWLPVADALQSMAGLPAGERCGPLSGGEAPRISL